LAGVLLEQAVETGRLQLLLTRRSKGALAARLLLEKLTSRRQQLVRAQENARLVMARAASVPAAVLSLPQVALPALIAHVGCPRRPHVRPVRPHAPRGDDEQPPQPEQPRQRTGDVAVVDDSLPVR
jgi:hypothetical protein